jgi:hypothetical protein
MNAERFQSQMSHQPHFEDQDLPQQHEHQQASDHNGSPALKRARLNLTPPQSLQHDATMTSQQATSTLLHSISSTKSSPIAPSAQQSIAFPAKSSQLFKKLNANHLFV